jgi:hypothetical protein
MESEADHCGLGQGCTVSRRAPLTLDRPYLLVDELIHAHRRARTMPLAKLPRSKHGCAMIELATTKHHHGLLYALAAAAGLGLGLALIAFCDAWYSGSGFAEPVPKQGAA